MSEIVEKMSKLEHVHCSFNFIIGSIVFFFFATHALKPPLIFGFKLCKDHLSSLNGMHVIKILLQHYVIMQIGIIANFCGI